MPVGWAFPPHRETWPCRHLPATGVAMPAGSLHTQAVMGFSPILRFTQTSVTALLSHLFSSLVLCLKGWGSHVQCGGHFLHVLCMSQRGGYVSCSLQTLWPLSPWRDSLCSVSPLPHIVWVQDLPCWRSLPMSHLSCLTLQLLRHAPHQSQAEVLE